MAAVLHLVVEWWREAGVQLLTSFRLGQLQDLLRQSHSTRRFAGGEEGYFVAEARVTTEQLAKQHFRDVIVDRVEWAWHGTVNCIERGLLLG